MLKTKVKLGVFIVLATVILTIAIFSVGEKEKLFTKTMKVSAYFQNIEGLRLGAPVRLNGINIGSVSNILIAPDTTGQIEVVMNIDVAVKRFIRENTQAVVETEGLVGNKIVNLRKGTMNFPEVEDGGTIKGVNPLGLASILEGVSGLLNNTKSLTEDFAEIFDKVNKGEGTIGKLVNDEALYDNVNSILITANQGLLKATNRFDTLSALVNALGVGVNNVVDDINKTVVNIDGLILDIKSGKGALGSLISPKSGMDTSITAILNNVVTITNEVKLGAGRFAENMEALKRNWLFSQYFENRGFYDKTGYELQLDEFMEKINDRIKVLDERLNTLKELEKSKK